MLVMEDMYHHRHRGGSSIARSSLLDLPTIARVERARLKYERENNSSPLQNTLSSNCPSLMSVGPSPEIHALKKGLLWQQRERLFSRWKERYFILTRDYLHCFKRSSSNEKISHMGQFIFKVKLVDVDKVEWVNKKSYSTVALALQDRDYRILLRTNDGLEDWYELLDECTMTSKERRKALRKFGNSPSSCLSEMDTCNRGDNMNEISNVDNWLLSRMNPAAVALDQSSLSDSVPDLHHDDYHRSRVKHLWQKRFSAPNQQQLSLLTDIDVNNCDSSVGTPSVPSTLRNRSYQFNNDIYFLSPGTNDIYYNSMYNQNKSGTRALDSLRSNGYNNDNTMLAVTRFKEGRFDSMPPSPSTSIKHPGRSRKDIYNYHYINTSCASNRCSYVSQQPTIV